MKITALSSVLVVLGLGSFAAFNLIGSNIAADGRLVEPFALIPLGWLLIVLGIAGLGFSFGAKLLHARS